MESVNPFAPLFGTIFGPLIFSTLVTTGLYGITCMQTWVSILRLIVAVMKQGTFGKILLLRPVWPHPLDCFVGLSYSHPSYPKDTLRMKSFVSQPLNMPRVIINRPFQVATLWYDPSHFFLQRPGQSAIGHSIRFMSLWLLLAVRAISTCASICSRSFYVRNSVQIHHGHSSEPSGSTNRNTVSYCIH